MLTLNVWIYWQWQRNNCSNKNYTVHLHTRFHTVINFANFEPNSLMLPLFLHISTHTQSQTVLLLSQRLFQPGPEACRSSFSFPTSQTVPATAIRDFPLKFRTSKESPKNPGHYRYPPAQNHLEPGATASTQAIAAKQKKQRSSGRPPLGETRNSSSNRNNVVREAFCTEPLSELLSFWYMWD